MKHDCCGQPLKKQYSFPNTEGGRTHVWKCLKCRKRYTQKTRVAAANRVSPAPGIDMTSAPRDDGSEEVS